MHHINKHSLTKNSDVILYIVLNTVHLHILVVPSMSYIVPNIVHVSNNSDFVANVNIVIITFSV